MISAPSFSSPSRSSLSTAFSQRSRATPPPATTPSARAAATAALASSNSALRLLHFGFGRGADFDLGHAAGELRQTLLQLLAIVIAVGRFDLAANLLGTACDRFLLAAAADDRRVVAAR